MPDNPREDWGLPGAPTNPPRRDVRSDGGGCWPFTLAVIVAGLAGVSVAVLLLFVDIADRTAKDNGRPLPPHHVGHTPTTYGPPPR